MKFGNSGARATGSMRVIGSVPYPWTTGYLDSHDMRAIEVLRNTLGPRFEVVVGRPGLSAYHARITEGADETIYTLTAPTIEQLCGRILMAIVKEKSGSSLGRSKIKDLGTQMRTDSSLIHKMVEQQIVAGMFNIKKKEK